MEQSKIDEKQIKKQQIVKTLEELTKQAIFKGRGPNLGIRCDYITHHRDNTIERCQRMAHVCHNGISLCQKHAPNEYQTEETLLKRKLWGSVQYYKNKLGELDGNPIAIEKLNKHRESARNYARKKAKQATTINTNINL